MADNNKGAVRFRTGLKSEPVDSCTSVYATVILICAATAQIGRFSGGTTQLSDVSKPAEGTLLCTELADPPPPHTHTHAPAAAAAAGGWPCVFAGYHQQ